MAKYIMPYNSEIGEKQGYARYAIRFSGGGYLHGTPINYEEETNREFFMRAKRKNTWDIYRDKKMYKDNRTSCKISI